MQKRFFLQQNQREQVAVGNSLKFLALVAAHLAINCLLLMALFNIGIITSDLRNFSERGCNPALDAILRLSRASFLISATYSTVLFLVVIFTATRRLNAKNQSINPQKTTHEPTNNETTQQASQLAGRMPANSKGMESKGASQR